MKIETNFLEDHQAKLRVEVDPEQLEQAKQRSARTIAKRAKIPGFRPGKAPYHIVERFAGSEAILEDAIEILLKDIYPKAIDESGIQPYGPGSLEGMPSGDPLTFEFIVPLKAEVELGDYRSIRQPYDLEPVSDEDVEKVFDNMREQQAVIEPVERSAQECDSVMLRLSGERLDPESGENKPLIREMPAPITIEPQEPEDAEEWPFPGFSRRLIGLSAGEGKTVHYTFPEDSRFETLRGAEAEFHFTVESVRQRQLPELNDDFAVTQGEYENLEALRTEVRQRLDDHKREDYEGEYNDELLSKVLEVCTVKFAPQMVEDEIDSMLHDLEHRLERQNMDMDTYLKTRSMDKDELRAEVRESAITRLKRMLVLFEISRAENITVPPDELQSEVLGTLNQVYGQMPPDQARKQINQETISNLTSSIMGDLLIQHTLKRLQQIGKGEEPEIATAELELNTGEAALEEEEVEVEAEVEVEVEAAETEEPKTETGE